MPPKKKSRPRLDDRLYVRADDALKARLERQAGRFGQTLSAYVRARLVAGLEADEATEPGRR